MRTDESRGAAPGAAGRRHMTGVRLPTTRAECIDGPRPCPHVTSRYHIWPDAKKGTRLEAMRETCALDVAERGGVTLSDLRDLLGGTKARAMNLDTPPPAKLEK